MPSRLLFHAPAQQQGKEKAVRDGGGDAKPPLPTKEIAETQQGQEASNPPHRDLSEDISTQPPQGKHHQLPPSAQLKSFQRARHPFQTLFHTPLTSSLQKRDLDMQPTEFLIAYLILYTPSSPYSILDSLFPSPLFNSSKYAPLGITSPSLWSSCILYI